jgi:hypothetical protein
VTEVPDDPLAQELERLDEGLGVFLGKVRDLPDRGRGARLVRAALAVLQKRGSHAAAVRLHILAVVDEQNEPDLDTLAELLSPEGEPMTRQAASKLRKKARELRAQNREGVA